jgi:hypothetical protein
MVPPPFDSTIGACFRTAFLKWAVRISAPLKDLLFYAASEGFESNFLVNKFCFELCVTALWNLSSVTLTIYSRTVFSTIELLGDSGIGDNSFS